jgi:hypothetical protein
MPNGLYAAGRQRFLSGDLDWDAQDVRTILADSADYTQNLSTHDFLDDVAAGGRVAVSGALTSKTVTGGTADAADVTWTSVTGDPCEQVIIYQHTGTDSTSALICGMDTFASGMPVTPNGGNINLAWNASGIFTL